MFQHLACQRTPINNNTSKQTLIDIEMYEEFKPPEVTDFSILLISHNPTNL